VKFTAFRGLRPRSDLASRVPCPPYDVLDRAEARRLAADDPYSFLHAVKPEIDLPDEVAATDDQVYDRARAGFRAMVEQGWLVQDEQPAFYVYRLEAGDHSQIGLVGLASVDDYVAGKIRKHELTRPDKEEDRARHIEALEAHAGLVLLTYRRVPELSALVRGVASREPAVDFTAPDGVRHSLWVVTDAVARERVETLFSKVQRGYIADGHHRVAAAARVAKKRRQAGGGPDDGFLAALFPSHQLRILDYNRLIRDLNGLEPEAFLDRVRQASFDVKKNHRKRRPPHKGSWGMYLGGGGWYLLTFKGEPESDDPVRSLDVAILSEHLLEPVLGIGDPRTDKRIEAVGGGRGIEELELRVDSGDYALAFAFYATAIEEVMRIADAGGIMPPKSTWFEPKLLSGMVVHRLAEPADAPAGPPSSTRQAAPKLDT
jgi:uncharacterized protein (DUF1015 family)